tara:strand:- start:149 stop:385 length:237 start_codon:yes stop_codon:yes gene_type:complete
LDFFISEGTTDKALGVENSVFGVLGSLVFGGVTNETFFAVESNIGRSSVEALIVSNDFDLVVLPDTNTGVSSAQINTN